MEGTRRSRYPPSQDSLFPQGGWRRNFESVRVAKIAVVCGARGATRVGRQGRRVRGRRNENGPRCAERAGGDTGQTRDGRQTEGRQATAEKKDPTGYLSSGGVELSRWMQWCGGIVVGSVRLAIR